MTDNRLVIALLADGLSTEDLTTVRRRLARAAAEHVDRDITPAAVIAELVRRPRLPGTGPGLPAAAATDPAAIDPAATGPAVSDTVHVADGVPDLPPLLRETWAQGGPLWVWRRARGPWRPPPVSIGIVGTRRPTMDGLQIARRMAGLLAEAGIEIVSGLARGIDQAAHLGALDAGGMSTAVIGTGLDVDYPARTGQLRRRLAESGGLVSEYPHLRGVHRPSQFLERNRILAGLVHGLIVIEAGARSGALNSAGQAATFGRDVMVVPASPSSPSAAGALALLRDGAIPVRDADDVLDVLGRPPASGPAGHAPRPDPRLAGLSDAAQRVLELTGPVPASMTLLAHETGLSARATMIAVSLLEEARLVTRGPAGVVRDGG